MKKINIFLAALITMSLGSCSLVGNLMKGSFYVGIIIALVVVFLVVWLISAFKGKG